MSIRVLRLCVSVSLLVLLAAIVGCRPHDKVTTVKLNEDNVVREITPDSVAMHRLAGIWVDDETETVIMLVRGDSIFYPDSANIPARFIIFEDTLLVFGQNNMRYPICMQGDYSFEYVNLQGDVIRLRRSEEEDDTLLFIHLQYAPIVMSELVKRDTVVFTPSGQRYHLYIDINPTRRRVYSSSYTDDGMAVQQAFFDNIIHISVYEGRRRVFSRDIDKSMFSELIPREFLDGAILSNMDWGRTDDAATVFHATVCEPEGARCYVVDLHVSFEGQLDIELVEY